MTDSLEWEKIEKRLHNEEYSQCIVLLEQLLSHHPTHPIYLYWLSYSLIQIHHPVAALETLTQFREAHPDKIDLDIATALLIAHFDATLFEEAEEIADKGMIQYPETPDFFRYKGLIVSRKDPKAASPFFECAHQLNPTEFAIPNTMPNESILQTACSWLPAEAEKWIQELEIIFALSPSEELLNQGYFPHHPLIPFFIEDNSMHIFLCNLRYVQKHQRPTSVLFEQLLSLWNQQ